MNRKPFASHVVEQKEVDVWSTGPRNFTEIIQGYTCSDLSVMSSRSAIGQKPAYRNDHRKYTQLISFLLSPLDVACLCSNYAFLRHMSENTIS